MLDFSFESFMNGSFDYDPASGKHTTMWIHADNAKEGTKKSLHSELDLLRDHPEIEVLTVSGLHQDSFEKLIGTYGKQLRAIRFFKNKYIEDWSLLGTLPQLEYVDFYQNHRLTKLWDMRGNTALTGLSIRDFSRLHSIEGISLAPALKYLRFGNTVREKAVIESLSPLAGSSVEEFSFSGKDVADKDLSFLSETPRLKVFNFPSNLYKTEEVAWIAANYPHLTGVSIRPYIEFTERNLASDGDCPNVGKVVGKNKPLLIFRENEERLRGYASAFEKMKERYAGLTYQEVFGGRRRKTGLLPRRKKNPRRGKAKRRILRRRSKK